MIRARATIVSVSIAAFVVALGDAGCAVVLGIGELDAGPPPAEAATSSDVDEVDSGADAEQCMPIAVDQVGADDVAKCTSVPGCAMRTVVETTLPIASKLPKESQRLCTKAQIERYISSCLGKACTPSQDDVGCFQCLFGSEDLDGAWVRYAFQLVDGGSGLVAVNAGGCVSVRDPCNTPCALVIEQMSACQASACAACDNNDIAQCADLALKCPCKRYAEAYDVCWAALHRGKSPAADCQPQPKMTAADLTMLYGTALCGL